MVSEVCAVLIYTSISPMFGASGRLCFVKVLFYYFLSILYFCINNNL